jgi:hypothetical protein
MGRTEWCASRSLALQRDEETTMVISEIPDKGSDQGAQNGNPDLDDVGGKRIATAPTPLRDKYRRG